jgi:hypothetical protein
MKHRVPFLSFLTLRPGEFLLGLAFTRKLANKRGEQEEAQDECLEACQDARSLARRFFSLVLSHFMGSTVLNARSFGLKALSLQHTCAPQAYSPYLPVALVAETESYLLRLSLNRLAGC